MPGVLLAVSGGIDSMYMANRSRELFPREPLAIAHCNFRLRGAESDGDEAFVRAWAEEHGIPCHVKRFNTEEYASQNGISIEMAARDLRYAWFEELRNELGFSRIAVAHNADDNAETLILNLLRGTGIHGICGMGDRGSIVRPLLHTVRSEIRHWMEGHGCGWREDSTNAETLYKRNLVRNEIFPLFARINPSFLRTLNADMQRFSQAAGIAAEYADSMRSRIFMSDGSIDVEALMATGHPDFLLWEYLEPAGIGAAEFASLTEALHEGRQIAGKRFGPVLGASGRLIITRGNEEPAAAGWRIERIPRSALNDLRTPVGTIIMDAAMLPGNLVVRPWKEGDWMRPLGMKGRKKLSDIFTDMHFSLADKQATRVLELDGQHVAAILCSRIDESVKVTDSTAEVLRITSA